MDLELVEDVADVEFDGVVADAKFFGGGLVVISFGKKFEQTRLVRRKGVIFALRIMKLAEEFYDSGGYFRRNRRASGHCFPDILQQLRRRGAFQQITTGSGAERVKDAIIVVINGQHEDLHFGETLFEDADAFDATHAWQANITQ